jgi:beta-xylosidase
LLRERQQNYFDVNSRRSTKSFSSKDSEEVKRTLPQTLEPHETTTTRAGLEACFFSGAENKTTGDGNSRETHENSFSSKEIQKKKKR